MDKENRRTFMSRVVGAFVALVTPTPKVNAVPTLCGFPVVAKVSPGRGCYRWVEQRLKGGEWTNKPGGGAGVAFKISGKGDVPAGSVVMLWARNGQAYFSWS